MSTKITVDNIANNSVGITQLNVSDGSNGQFLTTDGAGNLSFSSLGTLTTLTVDDITIDGSTISDSGTLLIDVGGNIELDADGGQVYFKDNGLTGLIVSRESTSIDLHNATTNSDFKFKGSDDGSNITALTLDMSEAGKATFNAGASFSHDVTIDADDRALRIGAGQDLALFHDATDSTMRSSTGDFIISNTAQNKDILFKGNDAGSTITALTLDMSEAGNATFNSKVTVGTNAVGTLTTDNDGSFDMSASNNFKCTPSGNFTLTFTNIVSQSGNILLINSGGHTVSAHSNTKVDANLLATVSTAGTYLLAYFSDGTNVYMTNSGAYT